MLSDYKISSEEITRFGVESAPDRLSGAPRDNKKVFDRLVRVVVAEKLNSIIELLASENGAENIGASGGTVAGHIASSSNPHSVTAEQIGAVTAEALQQALSKYMLTSAYKGTASGTVSRSDFCTTAQNGVWAVKHTKTGNTHKLSGIPTAPGMYLGQFWAEHDMLSGDTVTDVRGQALTLANAGATFTKGSLVRATVDTAQKKVWIG